MHYKIKKGVAHHFKLFQFQASDFPPPSTLSCNGCFLQLLIMQTDQVLEASALLKNKISKKEYSYFI